MAMTREIALDAAPDLKRIYATAVVTGRGSSGDLPDARAVRTGVRIDPDELVAYARVCGFDLRNELPLTYPHLVAFPLQMVLMSERAFPLPLMGAVHVENVITTTRAIRVDDILDVAVHAQNLRPHRSGRQVDLVSEVSVGGDLAWRGVSTYFSRGNKHPDAEVSEPPSREPLDAVIAGPVWRLGEGTGRSYAAVSGDWNPIHLHALTARPLGFPSAIAHGMYFYARVVASLDSRLPDGGLTSRVWFRKPVRLPSTVRLRTAFEPRRTLSLLSGVKGDIEHAVIEHSW